MKRLLNFYHSERGLLSVEFALTFIPFLLMFLLMAEVARLSYISAVLNLAVSEAGKTAKNSPSGTAYADLFRQRLEDNSGKLWHFITRADALKSQVKFSSGIDQLIADITNNSGSDSASNHPLARYRLEYKYHPMFFPIPPGFTDPFLRKEVIFVQEH